MSQAMASQPMPEERRFSSPETSPLAPVAMLPRSKASRRYSQATQGRAPTQSQPLPHTSPNLSGQSTPAQGLPTSTSISCSTSNSTSTSVSAGSNLTNTPHTPPEGTPIQPKEKDGVTKMRSLNGLGGSTTSVSGLIGLGMTGTSSAPVTTSHGAATALPSVQATPRTGASKMAAAAKRGQAMGTDGMAPVKPDGEEEEDHPLSEKSLKSRGYQTLHTLNRLFHLPNRWNLIRPLGQGAYGLVISVQDSLSQEPVAVKCITKVFDKVILARRALREITLLRHFGGHENLTGLIDLDHVWDGYNEIYLYMEPMEADLHQIIRSGQSLTNSHVQYFLYQLLRGMKYIHSANVIHRDLKPGNLLVNADCELKICDFGLARGFRPVTGEPDQQEELKLTEYVATRWYRAPEVMLSNRRYTTAIDVWSIGCILAELLGGKPIFKGKDYVDQLNLILGVLGTPDDATLDKVSSEKAAGYIRALPRSETVPLQLILPDADPQALDLLDCLLVFDPAERVDVNTALTHAYVGPYHDPADEPSCPELFNKWEEVESLQTIPELRAAITREIAEFREEVRTIQTFDDEEEVEVEELDEQVVLVSQSGEIVASPVHSTLQSQAGPSISPRSAMYGDVGVSPHTVTVPLPRNAESTSSPLGSKIPLSRNTSRERGRSRDSQRDSNPPTPATALSTLSEDSFSAAPMTGRISRRSSGISMHGRRPTSFLFSNPLGGGMTPMSTIVSLPGANTTSPLQSHVAGLPSATTSGYPEGYARPRSRAPSSTGEFNMRPLMRQLSTVGLDHLGKQSTGTLDSGHPAAPGAEDVPPLPVSASDAPPSEIPRNFSRGPTE